MTKRKTKDYTSTSGQRLALSGQRFRLIRELTLIDAAPLSEENVNKLDSQVRGLSGLLEVHRVWCEKQRSWNRG